MTKPIPIIYLPDARDQERLIRAIWTPANTSNACDLVDDVIDDLCPSTLILFSNGSGIDGYPQGREFYAQNEFITECAKMNSVEHFADYLKSNARFFKTTEEIYG